MIAPALYSSARGDWPTPPELVPPTCDLDVCATPENAKAPRFFTPADDGLAQPWDCAHAWCNPPYGRGVGAWLRKGWEEWCAGRARCVTFLLPARTDTRWWHEYVEGKARVQFLRGRVRFVGAPAPAPFPSVLVTYAG